MILSLRWRQLIWRLGLVLGVFSLLRAIFFFWNPKLFADTSVIQVAQAFLSGIRFDLSAILVVNTPLIVLSVLPWKSPMPLSYERFLKFLFLALNFPPLVVNLVDIEYIQFTGRRSDFALIGLGLDVAVKWSSLALEFWPLVLLGIGIMAALYFLYELPRTPKIIEAKSVGILAWMTSATMAALILIIGIRGGLQKIPVNLVHAATQNHHGLTQLTLNSTFTIIKCRGNATLANYDYFKDWDELRHFLRPLISRSSAQMQTPRRDNIIIIVVESLSSEYCGAGNGGNRYTPFFDSLAERSLFFHNHYANGRRSIESMPSILAGLPSLMNESFVESSYSDHPIVGLGSVLSSNGYTTSFFHGAKKGTMHFDMFMQQAGVQNYFGIAEYPDKSDFAGDWGIFDEPYLQYVAKQLTAQKPPFAALAFTLSSHSPYPIPEKHRGRFKKGTLPIHESIGYADHSLKEFFITAQQQPWYSNTLFIITGDHTQKLETPEYASILGHHRVPLILFHPRGGLPIVETNRVAQHADIFPTVLDYLGIQAGQQLLFGRSLFREGEGRAILHQSGHYWLVRGDRALDFQPGLPSRLFDTANDVGLKSQLNNEPGRLQELETEAKALVQYFNNGLLERKLYDRVEPSAAAQHRPID